MTILVGTDFSAAATHAVDAAAELARARGEQLALLHIVDGAVLPRHRARMVEEEARLAPPDVQPPLRVRALLERGNVGGTRFAEIVHAAGAAAVVVGAHGQGLRKPLGTLAQQLVRQVPQPLLVVRNEPRLLKLVFQRQLHVMVSLALDDTDDGVLECVRFLAQACALDVELVHYRILPEPIATALSTRELERDTLRAFGAPPPPRVSVRAVHVRDGFGRLDAHLADLAKQLDVDLVIAGSHHRHGAERMRDGSVAEGLIARAPVSVFIGRAPA